MTALSPRDIAKALTLVAVLHFADRILAGAVAWQMGVI